MQSVAVSRMWRRGLLAAGMLACVALLAACSGRRSEQQTEKGDVLFEIGRTQEALAAYREALDADPTNARAKLGQARCIRRQKGDEASVEAYQAAVKLAPESPEIHREAAYLLVDLGRIQDAEALAADLSTRDPLQGGVLQADLSLRQGNAQQALDQLARLAEQHPDNPMVRLRLGKAYARADRVDEAKDVLQSLVQTPTEEALAARMALVELLSRGDHDQMIQQLQKAVDEQPEDTGAKLALARALLIAGETKQAGTLAESVLDAQPDSGWARYVLGAARLASGERREAADLLQAAAQALPDEPAVVEELKLAKVQDSRPGRSAAAPAGTGSNAPMARPAERLEGWQEQWAQANLGELVANRDRYLSGSDPDVRPAIALAALLIKQPRMAEELAEELPEDAPMRRFLTALDARDREKLLETFENWQVAGPMSTELREVARGAMYAIGGARGAALETLSNLLNERPNCGVALLTLAFMFRDARMPEFEVRCLERLARMHPQSVEVQLRLFEHFAAQGDLDKARNQAQLTYALFPTDLRALRNMAVVCRRSGDLSLAEKVLEGAVKDAPKDTQIRLQLADLYIDADKLAEAEAVLDTLASEPGMRATVAATRALTAAMRGDWTPAGDLWESVKSSELTLAMRLLASAGRVHAGRVSEAVEPLRDAEGEIVGAEHIPELVAALGEAEPEKESTRALAQALAERPNLLAEYMLVRVLMAQEWHTAALERLRAMEADMPDPGLLSPAMLGALARARLEVDRCEAAWDYVEQRANHADGWLSLALICEAEENTEMTGQALERAVELAPDRPDAIFRLATYRDNQGDYETALALYERLVQIEPDNPMLQNNLAYALLQTNGSAVRARDLARNATDTLGPNPHALHTLGLAELRTGDYEQARVHFLLALQQRPGDPTLLFDYGQALIAQGDPENGRLHAQLALKYADQMGLDFPRKAEAEAVANPQ